jgi:hypothetical protein
MKSRTPLIAIALVASLALAACGGSAAPPAATSAAAPTATSAVAPVEGSAVAPVEGSPVAPVEGSPVAPVESSAAREDSVFCNGLVDLNRSADNLVQSLSNDTSVRAGATLVRELSVIAGRVEVISELESSTNSLALRTATQRYEFALRRIDLLASRETRTAAATSATVDFQSSLSSIAASAQCKTSTTDQLK